VELWDLIANGQESGAARERLGRKISEHLARVPFHLKISEQDFRYCPVTLSAALWQRFAAEVAGLLHPARCPAPNCGRWFLQGTAARSDKRFCCNACKNRAFRRNQKIAPERLSRNPMIILPDKIICSTAGGSVWAGTW